MRQIRAAKEQAVDSHVVMQEDFAENFNLKHQNEVMSAHWVSNSVTLFTAVISTKQGSTSYMVVSDEMCHDKFSVTAFNRAILESAATSELDIQPLHMFSDGAGSQFKNRFILSQVAKPALIHPHLRSLDWSFFGTAHGKGPVDGVGGTVKRAVWRRIMQGKVVVNNAHCTGVL